MANGPIAERNRGKLRICSIVYNFHLLFIVLDATIYVGGLDDKVTESLMWELFVQAGPLGNIFITYAMQYKK